MLTTQQKKLLIAVLSGLSMFVLAVYLIHRNDLTLGEQIVGKKTQCLDGTLYSFETGSKVEVTDIMGAPVRCYNQVSK
jgi:hypothetical protein